MAPRRQREVSGGREKTVKGSRPNKGVQVKRRFVLAMAAAAVGMVVAAAAYAAVNYEYQNGWVPTYATGSDLTVEYRNYNDSCSGDGFATTRSIYTTSDGSWVATATADAGCGWNKTHLGPSSNYGYTYVQSKCQHLVPSTYVWLICDTTRP